MNRSVGVCYLQLIGLTHLISVLMGAPILTDVIRTLFFSFYIVSIGFLPMIVSFKGDFNDMHNFLFQNEFSSTLSNSRRYLWMRNLVWGTIIGAWLGAIPIPLDWDRWWQRWPITCLVSSTMGAVCSLIISYLWLWIRRRQNIE